MSKLKKILLILNGLLLIAVLILSIYYWRHYFGAKPPTPDGGQPPEDGTVTIGPTIKPRIFLVTTKKVMAPHIPPTGNQVQYFTLPDYEIYASTFDGQTEAKIASPNFVLKELIKVIWAPNQNQLVAIFANENNEIQKYFYDLTTNLSNVLDPAIRSLIFSPDGQKIAFHYWNEQTGENLIALAEPTGLNQKLLWQNKVRDWQITWPALDKISLQTPPTGLTSSLAYEINPENSERKQTFAGSLGLETSWSPNGSKLLFSKIINQKPRLYLKADDKIQELNAVGLASKCLWQDNLNLYCGLSQYWPEKLTLPDDYYKGLASLSDEIWHFDLETSQKTKVASTDEFNAVLDVGQILVSPNNDYLFILNKKDNHLYGIRL